VSGHSGLKAGLPVDDCHFRAPDGNPLIARLHSRWAAEHGFP
jgi:hypothetical protein